jgi:transcriptional antiterminator NusG
VKKLPEILEKKWYVVHTYSGHENKVKKSLEERIKIYERGDYFGDILIPSEKVVEMHKGKKKETSRKFFPGYILINMNLNNETWHIVRDTPKVTGFVGGSKPTPISELEVSDITHQISEGMRKPKPKITFEKGDNIRVTDGPFTNFSGTVEEVKPDKGKVRVLVSIFGRSTPIELDFIQIEKS